MRLPYHTTIFCMLQYFEENPDYKNPNYNTKNGVYSQGCGLNNVLMSFGHDDYMYLVYLSILLTPSFSDIQDLFFKLYSRDIINFGNYEEKLNFHKKQYLLNKHNDPCCRLPRKMEQPYLLLPCSLSVTIHFIVRTRD